MPSFKFKELLPVVVYIICYNSHVSSDDSSGEGKLVNLGSGPHNHKLGPSLARDTSCPLLTVLMQFKHAKIFNKKLPT